ncbi:deoxyribonuclease IV [Patescibacteria group bacterium]|nr:deoxyribonuclease IV [Patescibacteria group bacterium]
MPILGGHVSAAGGALKAIDRAVELGFATLQIHPTSPQAWAKPAIPDDTAAAFTAGLQKNRLNSAFFHNIYLTNFASENQAGWHGSIEISKSYLQLSARMGVSGVITHLGSHKGAGLDAVLDRVVDGIKRMLAEAPADAYFLIENTAGAGGTIGRTLAEIERITERIWPEYQNVGICIDSCHAFASGIPIHTAEGLESFLQEFQTRFGLAALRCLHLNDSKGDFASNKDRHENIGDGSLGLEAFRHIVNHPKLQTVPMVMEVPGIENKGPDRENLQRLQALVTVASDPTIPFSATPRP